MSKLPIAIVSGNLEATLNWARRNLKVREYQKTARRIITLDNNIYYIIDNPDQVKGMTFSAIERADQCSDNPRYYDIMAEISHRVRS